jgi:hypothetical protein
MLTSTSLGTPFEVKAGIWVTLLLRTRCKAATCFRRLLYAAIVSVEIGRVTSTGGQSIRISIRRRHVQVRSREEGELRRQLVLSDLPSQGDWLSLCPILLMGDISRSPHPEPNLRACVVESIVRRIFNSTNCRWLVGLGFNVEPSAGVDVLNPTALEHNNKRLRKYWFTSSRECTGQRNIRMACSEPPRPGRRLQ